MARQTEGKRRMREVRREEFDQHIIDIARVTRVQAGGKKMRFRACVVVGDKKGRVGLGVKKGADVTIAVNKASEAAKKNFFPVTVVNDTIPHEVRLREGAAHILLKPAQRGRGVIAGGAIRAVIEAAGIKNVVSKMLGSKNKINNARATIAALKKMRTAEEFLKRRGV